MKKLQLITYNPEELNNYNVDIDINDFNKLKSLDNYDINIFDLTSNSMWENKGNSNDKPSENSKMSADFKSINQMIVNSRKSINIVCLPQNSDYYCKCYSNNYYFQLKDMIPMFTKILEQLIPVKNLSIIYENSETLIKNNFIDAAFYFGNDEHKKITSSNDSDKTTTIKSGNLIITTLNLVKKDSPDILLDYLNEIGLINDEIEYPDWIYKYKFNDDDIQNNNIVQAKEQIKLQKEIIDNSNKKLQENLRYKSILYTNSDKLVEVVFEILEYVFDISLKDFNDEKREDFLFKKNNVTFIGEIKGVTTNVKYENISQLEVHYSKYMDKLQEQGVSENIKKILIMNYQRTRDVVVRDEINKMQIDLAIKNSTLIIDTKNLLILYEKLLSGELNRDTIIKYIENTSGVININNIK